MKKEIRRASVVWYSQTGNTERYGRYIARLLRQNGIEVTSGDYRTFDMSSLRGADLVIAGTPVYYYEVPVNFRKWLKSLPDITGAAAASYVTFGGKGGNQHNTAYHLLRMLEEKGGIPAGMDTFGNMSTFAISWSTGYAGRVLEHRNKPDAGTYAGIADFVQRVLAAAREGVAVRTSMKADINELIKGTISIKGTKLLIGEHRIDEASCTSCGACVKKCPVGAITLSDSTVETSRCIACLGCVNNCPTGAMTVKFMGKKITSYGEFCKANGITLLEPPRK